MRDDGCGCGNESASAPETRTPESFTATRNACKLCTPLGACLAFKGVQGAVPLIHGSQGCATYIRRYLISHFREPVDIASSSFSEASTIFGGGANLELALDNVISQYKPELIGVATSCLSETIGDDVARLTRAYRNAHAGGGTPSIVGVSTPSFNGTHAEGFHRAIRALVETLTNSMPKKNEPLARLVNLFPGMLSPEDLRHLREICDAFALDLILLPDYSETLDAPSLAEYPKLPHGGTSVSAISRTCLASGTIELGRTLAPQAETAAAYLARTFGVPRHGLGTPIGIRECDTFFRVLEQLSGRATPRAFRMERGRLVDAYVDGHKYVFGKRAVIYGEEDLVVGLAAFLSEIGMFPVLCASGGQSGHMTERIQAILPANAQNVSVREGADFAEIEEEAQNLAPDLIVGNSKGYGLSRRMNVPLVRVGFPIHDRIGAQRVLHVGYRGAQQLFDRVVNALLDRKQAQSEVGYSYL